MRFAGQEFPCKSCVQQEKETKSPGGGEGTPEEWLRGGQDRAGKDRAQPSNALTPHTCLQSLGPLTHPHPSVSAAFISLSTHLKPSATQSHVLAQKTCPRYVLYLDAAAPTASPPWAWMHGNGHGCLGMGTDAWGRACKIHGLLSVQPQSPGSLAGSQRGQTPKAGIPRQRYPRALSHRILCILGSCGVRMYSLVFQHFC